MRPLSLGPRGSRAKRALRGRGDAQCGAWEGDHGVVAEGAVGSRLLGWTDPFRYEVRSWRDGQIPDVAEAVESPRTLSTDPALAARIVDLVPLVPTLTWGRDELKAGEMWNSNSLTSWLLAKAGLAGETS